MIQLQQLAFSGVWDGFDAVTPSLIGEKVAESGPKNSNHSTHRLELPTAESHLSGENVNPITQLLQQASAGDDAARGQLLEQVYEQLRSIARERMTHERKDHTLQATALVHEAYVRLLPSSSPVNSLGAWEDRGQFYRAAAEAMRRILIDHARRRGREKRGGSVKRMPINVCDLAAEENADEILALDDAITRLQKEDEAAAEVVRLRFFAGLSVPQTALVLGISERTVKREWSYARVKLFRLLEQLE